MKLSRKCMIGFGVPTIAAAVVLGMSGGASAGSPERDDCYQGYEDCRCEDNPYCEEETTTTTVVEETTTTTSTTVVEETTTTVPTDVESATTTVPVQVEAAVAAQAVSDPAQVSVTG